MAAGSDRYLAPGGAARVSNAVMSGISKLGVSLRGSRMLAVRGRASGQWRVTPVNPLSYAGARYLVAPRGQTQWVRNLRVSGEGELRLGRRVEAFTATELADDQKPDILRGYLKKWKAETGAFFGGVGPDASDEELRAIAPGYPVFRISAK